MGLSISRRSTPAPQGATRHANDNHLRLLQTVIEDIEATATTRDRIKVSKEDYRDSRRCCLCSKDGWSREGTDDGNPALNQIGD